ncbi:sporulation membrane protein YtaF [Cohnella panacarvi]|uniref:sporulation membrane protein YtaF n=1 Tax=Cohnella panacarvi TaxID=400776 RepID=UPI000478DFA5|nr:sporulation membrane protein YtaF [Cohnella panacarvi]
MLAHLASILLLAFAVSLDGFGVGITYGIRKIKIPVLSIFIIALCSGLIILLSMMVGVAMSGWLSPHGASMIGAGILIAIGSWALYRFLTNGDNEKEGPAKPAVVDSAAGDPPDRVAVLTLELRLFGIMIQILRTPSVADVDRSGTISAGEAFLLGAALSLDAFGAGIGAALVGFQPGITALLIAASSGLFLWMGTRVGFWASGIRWVRQLSMLPGIILIAMGIFKMF